MYGKRLLQRQYDETLRENERLKGERDDAHETLGACAELLRAPEIYSSNAMAIVMTLRVVIHERHGLVTDPEQGRVVLG